MKTREGGKIDTDVLEQRTATEIGENKVFVARCVFGWVNGWVGGCRSNTPNGICGVFPEGAAWIVRCRGTTHMLVEMNMTG